MLPPGANGHQHRVLPWACELPQKGEACTCHVPLAPAPKPGRAPRGEQASAAGAYYQGVYFVEAVVQVFIPRRFQLVPDGCVHLKKQPGQKDGGFTGLGQTLPYCAHSPSATPRAAAQSHWPSRDPNSASQLIPWSPAPPWLSAPSRQ